MANDAGPATTCRRNFKAPWLQTERTKNEGPSGKLSFNGEQFENFQPKNQKIQSWYGEQNKKPQDPNAKTEHEPCSQEELNWSEIEKAFRMKLLEFCKTRTKQSNPDLLTFYVISGGHDMANDAGPATTCRRNFKAPWFQIERTKSEGSSEKMSFNAETVWKFQSKKPKNPVIVWRTKQKNHETPKAKTEHETCSQEELNWSEIEKPSE